MALTANRSSKVADRVLRGAVSAIAILHSNPALAADDPFALDSSSTGAAPAGQGEAMLVEAVVNGETKARLVELRVEAGGLSIRVADAVYLGLPVRGARNAFVPVADIEGISFSYDAQRVRLEISQLRSATGPNLVDMGRARGVGGEGSPLTALVIDYDGILRADRRGVSAAALANFRLSRETVSLESGWQLNSRPASGIGHAVRLDSALTLVDEARGLRAVLGDFVSSGTANRSLRLAGLQLTTDFSTRPDLITYPLPELSGSVSLPSGLDVLVNDRRIAGAPVEAGDFTVRNVPVPVGRNQVGVVVKNALGVEEVRMVQFYTSASMLAPGLSSSHFNLGFVRRRYGIKSNDYGRLAFSVGHRRGLSDRLTAEANVEVARHFYNLGAAGVFTLGDLGAVKLGVNRSSLTPGDVASRKGTMLTLGLESAGGPVSATIEARHATAGYDDLASANGDLSPFSRISASLNFDLRDYGQVQLSAIRQYREKRRADGSHFKDDKSNYLGLSYRLSARDGINLFADIAVDPGRKKSLSLLLGISVQFGKRAVGQASANRQPQGADYQFSLFRPDVVAGDIGYHLSAGTGYADRASGGVSYRGNWGRVEGRAEHVAGETAGSVGAQGSLVFAEGSLFAANRTGEAFALVRTGETADISILRDNRHVGTSNKAGVLLVTDLPAYVPVKIGLDAQTAPVDSVVVKDSAVIRTAARSGRLVELPVERFVAGTLQILGFDGRVLAPGTAVTALPSKTELIVGFDGILEFDQARGDTDIEYRTSNGERCYAAIPVPDRIEAHAHIGVAACAQRVRTIDIAAFGVEPPAKPHKLKKRNVPKRDFEGHRRRPRIAPPPPALRPVSPMARQLRLFGG